MPTQEQIDSNAVAKKALVTEARAIDGRRFVACPFCGHVAVTSCCGAVYCGPHDLGNGRYEPAIRMIGVERWKKMRSKT